MQRWIRYSCHGLCTISFRLHIGYTCTYIGKTDIAKTPPNSPTPSLSLHKLGDRVILYLKAIVGTNSKRIPYALT
jgi:hypothetical protein